MYLRNMVWSGRLPDMTELMPFVVAKGCPGWFDLLRKLAVE